MVQQTKAMAFRAMHTPEKPLILYNVWDAGSAAAVAKSGARALATSSWSIAAAHGFADGEQIDVEALLTAIGRICSSTELPVSVDLESGYGVDAKAVARAVEQAIEAGAIGCNLEDSYPETGKLRDLEEQCERLREARSVAYAMLPGFFLNARTDLFFQSTPDRHDDSLVDQALARAIAYVDAGADGLFAPGLTNLRLIERLVERCPIPVNIMRIGDTPAIIDLVAAGVARISHGPAPFIAAMARLEHEARELA